MVNDLVAGLFFYYDQLLGHLEVAAKILLEVFEKKKKH